MSDCGCVVHVSRVCGNGRFSVWVDVPSALRGVLSQGYSAGDIWESDQLLVAVWPWGSSTEEQFSLLSPTPRGKGVSKH